MLGSKIMTNLLSKLDDRSTEVDVPSEGDNASVKTEIARSDLAVAQLSIVITTTYAANIGPP